MHPAIAAAVTEAQYQSAVENALDAHGWDWVHIKPNIVCPRCGNVMKPRERAGAPDLISVGEGILLLKELKRQGGRRRPDQIRWMGRLQRVERVVAGFYEPADWDDLYELIRTGGTR